MIEPITPRRLAAIAARNDAGNGLPHNRIVASLCRALTEAWRERDAWRERCEASYGADAQDVNEAALDRRNPTHG